MTYNKDSIVFQPKPTIHNFKDLEGQTFNRLTVLGFAGTLRLNIAFWFCECSCGIVVCIRGAYLRNGHTKSCGCFKNEGIRDRSITHGMRHTPEYKAYVHAKDRCRNPNDKSYPDYGGRGIEFRFQSFEEFFAEAGYRPSPKLSIHRIDNEGHYEIGNIEWATKKVQSNHRRNNVLLTFNGKTQTQAQWSEELNIHRSKIGRRLRKGWSDEKTLSTPYTSK